MKLLRIVALCVHGFVGLGAVAGGLGAMMDPVAPMGTSTELLMNSPFETFFIPGLLLFTTIGLTNLAAFVVLLRWPKSFGYVDGATGATLVGWIVVQCIMLQMINGFHVVFFAIGMLQFAAGTLMLFHHRQFQLPWCSACSPDVCVDNVRVSALLILRDE